MAATFHSTRPRSRVKATPHASALRRLVPDRIGCPCCGDPMHPDQIVCWPCFRSTDRLTPGSYPDPTFAGHCVRLDADDVDRWESARDVRREGGAA